MQRLGIFNPWNPEKHISEPSEVWRRIKACADIQNLCIHDLRRTVGSYECMSGMNLSVVSKTLNHKILAATQVYARVDVSAVGQALQQTLNVFEGFRKQTFGS